MHTKLFALHRRQTDDTKTRTCSSQSLKSARLRRAQLPEVKNTWARSARCQSSCLATRGRRRTKGVHDTLRASCEVPSKRERENPGRKPSARSKQTTLHDELSHLSFSSFTVFAEPRFPDKKARVMEKPVWRDRHAASWQHPTSNAENAVHTKNERNDSHDFGPRQTMLTQHINTSPTINTSHTSPQQSSALQLLYLSLSSVSVRVYFSSSGPTVLHGPLTHPFGSRKRTISHGSGALRSCRALRSSCTRSYHVLQWWSTSCQRQSRSQR